MNGLFAVEGTRVAQVRSEVATPKQRMLTESDLFEASTTQLQAAIVSARAESRERARQNGGEPSAGASRVDLQAYVEAEAQAERRDSSGMPELPYVMGGLLVLIAGGGIWSVIKARKPRSVA